MKKIISIFVLVIAFTFTSQAQKKGGKPSAEKMLKKMTKDLNLTTAQQSQIMPLLTAELADRKEMKLMRDKMKNAGEKPSKKERKQLRKDREAKEVAMDTKMKSILTKEQYLKMEEIKAKRKEKTKKRKRENQK
ncbi:MAG: hypothetical protein AB8B78_04880 [Polaribacter sp.]